MTEIDDEMVKRAVKAFTEMDGEWATCREQVLCILEAALNPKPEPEIEVTEGMERAGMKAWQEWVNNTGFNTEKVGAVVVYRAMESTRLKEAQECDQRVGSKDRRSANIVCSHVRRNGHVIGRRSTDKIHYRELPITYGQEGAAYAAKDATTTEDVERAVASTGDWVEYPPGTVRNFLGETIHRRKDDGIPARIHRRKGDRPEQFYGMTRE